MKSKLYWLPIAALILMCVIGWTGYAQKKVVSRVTWEYKTVGLSASYPVEKELNGFGAQGWELVDVSEVGGVKYYFFKRAK